MSELRERMSQMEYVQWKVYHGRKTQRQELEAKKAGRKTPPVR